MGALHTWEVQKEKGEAEEHGPPGATPLSWRQGVCEGSPGYAGFHWPEPELRDWQS